MTNNTQTGQAKRTLWERILELLEENLVERRVRRLYVELRGECGPYQKEIGELSTPEIRNLEPWSRERVVEYLVDRYLAARDRVDLLGRKRAHTKNIQDLTSEDLPAVLEADRYRADEHRTERERADFVRQVVEEMDSLFIVEPSRVSIRGRSDGGMEAAATDAAGPVLKWAVCRIAPELC
jgi:hypothetical protein